MNIQSKPNIRLIEGFIRPLLWLSAVFLVVLTLSKADVVIANPEDGSVVSGSATVGVSVSSPGTLEINQVSEKAIIDWQRFNIAEGETTRFSQPSSSSIALNRVNPNNGVSDISGNLSSNGQLWLLNPAGIVIGPNGRIDVAGLLATTANITNADFLSGQYRFVQSPD